MVEISKTIKSQLKKNLLEKKLKRSDLAEYTQVSDQAVGKWVKEGKVSVENIPKVASFLGIQIAELMTNEIEKINYKNLSETSGNYNIDDKGNENTRILIELISVTSGSGQLTAASIQTITELIRQLAQKK